MAKLQAGGDHCSCSNGATSDNDAQERKRNDENNSNIESVVVVAEAIDRRETSSNRPGVVAETIDPEDRADKGKEAFVTMVISNDFAIGAEVMFQSLRDHSRIRRPHVVLVTSAVSEGERKMLKAATDEMVEVRRNRQEKQLPSKKSVCLQQ